MIIHDRALAAGAAVILVSCLTHASAQDTQSRIFRVDADLVVVDLVATDRNGRFVPDLQPSELELLEDGKRQEIQFVRLAPTAGAESPAQPSGAVATATAPASGAGSAPPAAPPDSPAAAIAVVLDLSAIPVDAMTRVREAILEMVNKELPADARVMVASVSEGVTLHQTFTTDRSALKTALYALPAPAGRSVGFAQMLDVAEQLCATAASRSDPMPAFEQMIALGKAMLADSRRQITGTSDGLRVLARSLAAIPGRKHVVLYSTGYPLDPVNHIIELAVAANSACAGTDPAGAPPRFGATGRDQSGGSLRRRIAEELSGTATFDVATMLQAMLDRANRSQVSFYTIDPRGLATTSAQATQAVSARTSRTGQFQRFVALETTLPQEFLRIVAGDTGGRAFLNTNDLTAGLRRAWADTNEYYLIGYKPATTAKPGTYHRIDLKVRRPDLDLRFRRGYYTATAKEIATTDIEQALRYPAAFEHTGLNVEAAFNERGKLRIVALIPPAAVRFTPGDRGSLAEISVHATLRDEQGTLVGGKPLFGRDITLRLNPMQLETLLKSDNVEIPIEVDPPAPAKYRLTVVAREGGSWIGAHTIDLTIKQ